MYDQISKDTLKELFKIWKAKNIEDLDEATEINGIKSLFSNWNEYNIVLEFWNDLHDYLTSNYDFER